MMQRKIYLNMQSRQVARDTFLSRFSDLRTGEEDLASREAHGRVTARPVTAKFSAPSFHSAAMDGLAVLAENTFGASDESPLTLHIDSAQARPINTGHPMPDDTNAVIMIENVVINDDNSHGVIRAPVYPWQNVRKVGEDIVATELLFPTGHQLRPADLAALLTAGCATVTVRKQPKVTIIPTGTELVNLGKDMASIPAGKTVESNSAVLAGLSVQAGAMPTITPVIADDYETIKKHLLAAIHSDADLVAINAGSSAGSADYTVEIIGELGEVMTHGVTIMPGKPTILGCIEGKPVVGVPGYPVSAIIAFEEFVIPLLMQMQAKELIRSPVATAILAKDLPSRGGIEEYRRMVTGRIQDHFVTVPLKKGAGAITTLTRANSMLHIPAPSEGETKGTEVEIELLNPQQEVDRTILCTGSHDLCLELLHDFLKQGSPAYPLASTHVGSLGGIMALKANMTHIAGAHLLNPADGTYNISYLEKYLSGRHINLITLVHRQQGFIVQPGNPKNISSIADLMDDSVTFINRQAGSGTRVLLDYELERNDVDADEITGYDHDEYTHMAVAVAVLSGKADTGLGIMSAARALQLDFVPVTEERYDLLIPEEFMELDMVQALLAVISSDRFKRSVERMGGYSTRDTGVVQGDKQ